MARFCLPRDIYHGKDALATLKTLKGKRAIIGVRITVYARACSSSRAGTVTR